MLVCTNFHRRVVNEHVNETFVARAHLAILNPGAEVQVLLLM